jgi:hypothetical protein
MGAMLSSSVITRTNVILRQLLTLVPEVNLDSILPQNLLEMTKLRLNYSCRVVLKIFGEQMRTMVQDSNSMPIMLVIIAKLRLILGTR